MEIARERFSGSGKVYSYSGGDQTELHCRYRMPVRDYPFKRYGFYDRQAVAAVLQPSYPFQSQRGSWRISGIVRFGVGPNYIFFVSFGQTQAEHEFDEVVYDNGVIRWQSQPSQKLTDPVIQKLVSHDHFAHDILLFLRTSTRGPYAFMGFLKYVNHDKEHEQPGNFHWRILDFDPKLDYESLMGLRLQLAMQGGEGDLGDAGIKDTRTAQSLTEHSPPSTRPGIGLSTREFLLKPVDYEARDCRNRGLGKIGERLVLEHEKEYLKQNGRADLAAKVDAICWTIGDGLGYDIKSFDPLTGEEIHIEVKTTVGPPETPFYMTAPEISYAKGCSAKYRLYRVHSYTGDKSQVPFFIVDDPFSKDRLHLTQVSYRVRLK